MARGNSGVIKVTDSAGIQMMKLDFLHEEWAVINPFYAREVWAKLIHLCLFIQNKVTKYLLKITIVYKIVNNVAFLFVSITVP